MESPTPFDASNPIARIVKERYPDCHSYKVGLIRVDEQGELHLPVKVLRALPVDRIPVTILAPSSESK